MYILISGCAYLQAQPEILWEQSYTPAGGKAKQSLIVEHTTGDIALFVETNKNQLQVIVLSSAGEQLQQTTFNWKQSKLEAVVTSPIGYLLVGQQRGQPVIWSLNTYLSDLQQQPIALANQKGIFRAIKQNTAGHFFITGQVEERFLLLQLDDNLQVVNHYETDYTAAGNAICIDPFGTVFATGYVKEKPNSLPALWKFDAQGTFERLTLHAVTNRNEKAILQTVTIDTFPNTLIDTLHTFPAMGTDVIVVDNNDLLLLGNYQPTPYTSSTFTQLMHQTGYGLWQTVTTSENSTKGKSITQLPDRNFLVIGSTTDFGAFSSDIWWSNIKKDNGQLLWQQAIGGNKTDHATDMIKLKNGNIVVVGIRDSIRQQVQLFCWKGSTDICQRLLPPNEQFYFQAAQDNPFALTTDDYTFKGTILSRSPLEYSSISVWNESISTNSKTPSADHIQLTEQPSSKGQFCYTLQKQLYLEKGLNRINLNIQEGGYDFADSTLLYHLPQRPNLYVLSVGIEYDNLRYTDEDASDIAAIFKRQEGRLYGKVDTLVLTTKAETEAAEISAAIQQIKRKVREEKSIRVEDVVLLFLSAHGKEEADQFVIPGSDYRSGEPRTRIHFQQEIMDIMSDLPCKRLILIDACKSGGAKGNTTDSQLAQAIFDATQQAPGLTTITSSDATQLSYEEAELGNGLFTAAIKKALTEEATIADTDGNHIITVGELHQFLQVRLQELITEYMLDSEVKQTPTMPYNELGADYPIYFISY